MHILTFFSPFCYIDLPGRTTDCLRTRLYEVWQTRSHLLTSVYLPHLLLSRIVHSRNYIILYLGMAALSITTVIFSLMGDCPPLAFYVLEVIVNGVMILEVAIRVVAFGRQFFTSTFNLADLGITFLCVITLLVVLFTPCSGRGKEEEIFDTLLLVARNFFQFGRLALIMRRSGTSIFHRPPPIDLSSAREAAFALDIDLEDDEAVAQHQLQTNLRSGSSTGGATNSGRGGAGGSNALYTRVDAGEEMDAQPPRRGVGPVGGDRGRENLNAEDEEMWDRLG
ncbi:hypothetical protein BDY24DRAFT_368046 [Mrakia frigida]|uniref:uncharacterized protein n=1 Tax=Mrakia frigida TaxID=29902 RepID=UPI003FCC0B5C